MKGLEDIMSDWKKLNSNLEIIQHISIKKNKSIMDSIINYEEYEKKEKLKQIQAAISLIFLIPCILMIMIYWTDQSLSHQNYIGIILLVGGIAFSIISNRTDDFPDIRLMASKLYLKAYKENLENRKKRHYRNAIIGGLLAFPGFYLTCNSFMFNLLGNWWVLFAALGAVTSIYQWGKEFHKKFDSLSSKLDRLIKNFDH